MGQSEMSNKADRDHEAGWEGRTRRTRQAAEGRPQQAGEAKDKRTLGNGL